MLIRGPRADNDNVATPSCRVTLPSISEGYENLKYSIYAADMNRLAECVLSHYRDCRSIPMPYCIYDDGRRLTEDERDVVHMDWNTRHRQSGGSKARKQDSPATRKWNFNDER